MLYVCIRIVGQIVLWTWRVFTENGGMSIKESGDQVLYVIR